MLEYAIVGAGPYGLSIAAHFRHHNVPFRIFGPPMDSWRHRMPKGMMLKSDGFASNLYDPTGHFKLAHYCAEQGIEYHPTHIPVRLETFAAYGVAFAERLVPELEDKLVVGVARTGDGFTVDLDTGESVAARRVILAVGITHYGHVPDALAHLPPSLVSHSYGHNDLEPFRGRRVAVIGGGASAIGLATLMRESGALADIVVRAPVLKFPSPPGEKPRSLWQRLRHPSSGLGPGMRSRFFSDAPWAFQYLPEALRIEAVRRSLGPSGHYYSRSKIDKVPQHLGCSVVGVDAHGDGVRLQLRSVVDGSTRPLDVDHVVAGTGYKVDLARLPFLAPALRDAVRTSHGSPVLSPSMESSVPGLYFVGLSAAYRFGPVMRFAFGAGFAARTLTRAALRAPAPRQVAVPVRIASAS
jgi:thioredoxin reductase